MFTPKGFPPKLALESPIENFDPSLKAVAVSTEGATFTSHSSLPRSLRRLRLNDTSVPPILCLSHSSKTNGPRSFGASVPRTSRTQLSSNQRTDFSAPLASHLSGNDKSSTTTLFSQHLHRQFCSSPLITTNLIFNLIRSLSVDCKLLATRANALSGQKVLWSCFTVSSITAGPPSLLWISKMPSPSLLHSLDKSSWLARCICTETSPITASSSQAMASKVLLTGGILSIRSLVFGAVSNCSR
mmetsp:Transcript_53077/g.95165  ORF Transcript_53077/g.95165 Transcript_53077/m.95165 type:complete len:243 (+) Transcript_53077:1169-1897(+)